MVERRNGLVWRIEEGFAIGLLQQWPREARPAWALAATPLSAGCTAPLNERPHILLAITNAQKYGDVAAHGVSTIRTPNLVALHDKSALDEFSSGSDLLSDRFRPGHRALPVPHRCLVHDRGVLHRPPE